MYQIKKQNLEIGYKMKNPYKIFFALQFRIHLYKWLENFFNHCPKIFLHKSMLSHYFGVGLKIEWFVKIPTRLQNSELKKFSYYLQKFDFYSIWANLRGFTGTDLHLHKALFSIQKSSTILIPINIIIYTITIYKSVHLICILSMRNVANPQCAMVIIHRLNFYTILRIGINIEGAF